MAVQKLTSGRWRATVTDPSTRKRVSAATVLGLPEPTFARKHHAQDACSQARALLVDKRRKGPTVKEWADVWTSDPLYQRPKASTNKLNRQLIHQFVDAHPLMLLADVDDVTVARWIRGGRRTNQVPALRAMFNDARSAKAGRLIRENPWANLGLATGPGRRNLDPPSEETVRHVIQTARAVSGPSFAAWLQVAAFTGLRPGELDALQWEHVDTDRRRILVCQQFNAATRTVTAPKNGRSRFAPLTAPALDALQALPRQASWCFPAHQAPHWTATSRRYHWRHVQRHPDGRLREHGFDGPLYLCGRHFAGWWMVNVLGMASEDVAIAFGHQDGGELVRVLYGHREHEDALDRIVRASAGVAEVVPIRREETG